MSEPEIFQKLRDLITEDHSIMSIANRAEISYAKLYRFKKKKGNLSVIDTDKLSLALTGKPLFPASDV